MSATAATEAAAPAPVAKGKKKLIIIAAALAVLLAAGGGAAVYFVKKSAAAEAAAAEEGDDHAGDHSNADGKSKVTPVFVPLEPFTVNLADRDAERYAQVGITLEVDDAKVGDQVKAFMPAIRNHILMAISDRNAAELMGREGKTRLADTVRRETSRVLGAEVDAEPAADDDAAAADKPKKKKKKATAALPVKAVHFSNFIIQ